MAGASAIAHPQLAWRPAAAMSAASSGPAARHPDRRGDRPIRPSRGRVHASTRWLRRQSSSTTGATMQSAHRPVHAFTGRDCAGAPKLHPGGLRFGLPSEQPVRLSGKQPIRSRRPRAHAADVFRSTRSVPGGVAIALEDDGRSVVVDLAAFTEPSKTATTASTAGSSTQTGRCCAAVLRSTSSRAASLTLIPSSSLRRRCVGPMPQYCVSSDQMVTVELRRHRCQRQRWEAAMTSHHTRFRGMSPLAWWGLGPPAAEPPA